MEQAQNKGLKMYYRIIVVLLSICFPLLGQDALIVSYVTAHLNEIENAVVGVLVTPDGTTVVTSVIDPFDNEKIIIESPPSGNYQAYFRAIKEIPPRLCYIVGGIDAHMTEEPYKVIEFTPKEAHIQGFNPKQEIIAGSKTQPIAEFFIN